MLKPDPDVNSRDESAWFGVLTWIQPEEEVVGRRARLVSNFVLEVQTSTQLYN